MKWAGSWALRKKTRSGAHRGWKGVLVILLGLALVAVACGDDGDAAADDEVCLKVGFIYVGSPTDNGWNYAHEEGRKYLEEQIPCVETRAIESVPESPDSEVALRELADQGYTLIFGTSFGFMDYMVNVAQEYPDVKFEHCSGYKTADNLAVYFTAAEEAAYLSGLAAGFATETDKAGYVGPFPIPLILRHINAFTIGIREANPEATNRVVWVNTWADPALERQATLALLDAGIDVVGMNMDTSAVGQAVQERDAHWVGFHTAAMATAYPEGHLVLPVYNWGVYYVRRAQDVLDGNWASHDYYGGLADGMTELSPYGPDVSEEAQALIEQRKQEIIDGEFNIFAGPLKDQAGNVVIPEGQVATLEELLVTDYLVEGTLGEIPAG
jgi:basic membrane protein A